MAATGVGALIIFATDRGACDFLASPGIKTCRPASHTDVVIGIDERDILEQAFEATKKLDWTAQHLD